MQEAVFQQKSTNLSNYDEEISLLLQHQKRLSLAYGALDNIPYLILKYIADKIQILDLSHNKFRNLAFLENFPNLQTLVLDKNSNLDCQSLPVMENLEVLWSTNLSNYDEEISLLLQHQKRLSLAYGALDNIPYLILKYIADKIQILDLSHNKFRNLAFLENFPNLQTLVLDKNSNLDCQSLPVMENLEVLWLNNCNLINITDWLQTLQVQCPVLRQLSMMCNPVGLTVLNGVSDGDEKEYRKQVLKILPSLEYFDGIKMTDEHRRLAAGTKVSMALIEEIFRKKIKNFIEFSTKIQTNYMSMEKLNAAFVKNKSISAKCTSS